MAKDKKVTAGEKAAKVSGLFSTRNQIIGGIFLLLSVVLAWFLNNKSTSGSKNDVQNIREQKVDTGTIHNYNAAGDIRIETNVYSGKVESKDSISKIEQRGPQSTPIKPAPKKDLQVNVTSNNQSGGQTANQIINNN